MAGMSATEKVVIFGGLGAAALIVVLAANHTSLSSLGMVAQPAGGPILREVNSPEVQPPGGGPVSRAAYIDESPWNPNEPGIPEYWGHVGSQRQQSSGLL